MQGLTILYALFARDLAEIDAARGEQLNVQRPSVDSLYPAYMWESMSQAARDSWIDEEARRYDRFNRLVSMTVLPVSADEMRKGVVMSPCNVYDDENEAALLTYIWNGLQDADGLRYQICGWKIRETIWPRLVNRSLKLGVNENL